MARRVTGIAASLVVATALLTLTGCSAPVVEGATGEEGYALSENALRLSDGRTVTCVVYKAGYAGGLSCDWDGATR